MLRRIALYLVRWLVRHRVALFVATVTLAVFCALMIPNINVNTDMTSYLPESYSMKQGMEIMETEFTGLEEQASNYSLSLSEGIDALPKGLGKTIIIGVAMAFVVLIIMCSSFLEVVLFLITIGVAVLINVGSNALLPSVSQTTNMISPVLQMVLSMDYCIIMMNRYRDERVLGKEPVTAMNRAVGGTAAPIFSSAFTTIVSLLMLCFIKLKIGADLGIVLAKGVAISLVCTFTLLPALIIWCRKAIEASRKKVPVLPAASMAKFQFRFRYPIAALFLAAVIAFGILQSRTPIFFAPPGWDKDEDNTEEQIKPMMLIYSNEDEAAITDLLDKFALDPRVVDAISYPSLMEKPRTATEMMALVRSMAGDRLPEDIPDSLLSLVYYARSHPARTETFSLATLQESAESLKASGLMPEGRDFDIAAMVQRTFASPAKTTPAVQQQAPEEDNVPAATDSVDTPADSTAALTEPLVAHNTPTAPDDPHTPTYERITTPLGAAEMAEFLQTNPKQVSMLYRMAGRKGGEMTPDEFIRYVRKNILGKKKYAMFLPKGSNEDMARTEALYDRILAAGPDTTAVAVKPDPSLLADAQTDTTAVDKAPETPVVKKPAPVPYTPLDALIDMHLSGKRYSSEKVCRALQKAGIKVTKDETDLLYLYTGAMRDEEPETKMSPLELLNFLADTLLVAPSIASLAGDSARVAVVEARDSLLNGLGALRGPKHSAAVLLTTYEVESERSFAFVDSLRAAAGNALKGEYHWVSESEMYKELKDGFPRELLMLTLLTILALYLIVGINFRSFLVPIPLIMTVLSGVYANVIAGGFGGDGIYYLAYLIVQGILMGATIDYSILFTTCYLYARQADGVQGALEAAYRGSSHSILTSGLILALVPFAMSFTMQDVLVAAILKNLSIGAAVVLVFILCLLPGVLATLAPLLKNRKKFKPRKRQ